MIGQFLLLEDHRLFALIILFYAPIILFYAPIIWLSSGTGPVVSIGLVKANAK